MCDFPQLSRKMFEGLEDIKAGRFVYVIALRPSDGGQVSIEDVVIGEILDPEAILVQHCKAKGLAIANRLCLPVILPPGLKAEDIRGFRPVRTEKAVWIEYTQEGPERPDRILGQ